MRRWVRSGGGGAQRESAAEALHAVGHPGQPVAGHEQCTSAAVVDDLDAQPSRRNPARDLEGSRRFILIGAIVAFVIAAGLLFLATRVG